MRSDAEIKEFIDSKEALTKHELVIFIFGERSRSKLSYPITETYWQYVLDTKDWKTLKEYQQFKIKYNRPSIILPKLFELYKHDKRLGEYGRRRLMRLLKEVYNFKISNTTALRFLQQIRGKNA